MLRRLLQTNLNHSVGAQDLFRQTLAERQIELAVAAEPYCALQGWLESEDGSVAMVGGGGPHPLPFMPKGRGEGFVAAKWGETVVVGVYSSPNGTLPQLEQLLGRVGAIVIASHPSPVLVAGDFNAKSALWNFPVTDARGGVVAD